MLAFFKSLCCGPREETHDEVQTKLTVPIPTTPESSQVGEPDPDPPRILIPFCRHCTTTSQPETPIDVPELWSSG